MKKTYIIPQTEVVRVATQSICVLSGGDPDNQEYTLPGGETPAPEGEDGLVKGNSFNIWGDDDWDD